MKEILAKLVEGKDLTKEEAMKAQELILTGQATEAQIAGSWICSGYPRRNSGSSGMLYINQ